MEFVDDENLVRRLLSEDTLRAEAQYWADAALARRLAAEETATTGLDASPDDVILETMQSERLASFGHERGRGPSYAKASSSRTRRLRHRSGGRAPVSCGRGHIGQVSPPRSVGED